MNRYVTKLLSPLMLAASVVSCSTDHLEGTLNAGSLSLVVEADSYVTVCVGEDGDEGSTLDTGFLPAKGATVLTMRSTDGKYAHTWENVDDFPAKQYFFTGDYILSATNGNTMVEGFDTPSFAGDAEVHISDYTENVATITLSLANSLVKIDFTDNAVSAFSSISARVHTTGGLYHEYSPVEKRFLCLKPGYAEVVLDIELADGRRVNYPAYEIDDARSATLHMLTVDCTGTPAGEEVTVSGPEGNRAVVLTEAFINAEAPVITASWDASEIYDLPEGDIPESKYAAQVTGASPLTSIILSTLSLPLAEDGFPAEVDLLNLTPAEATLLRDLGLDFKVSPAGGEIDYTRLLGRLVYLTPESAISSMSLMAVSADGKSSLPVTLNVRSTPVEIAVGKIYPVTMGVNQARVDISCGASGFMEHVEIEIKDPNTGLWKKVEDVVIDPKGDGTYTLTFGVGTGSGPVEARVLYCEEVRATLSVPREMPPFSIEVDAYATMAGVKVVPEDPDMLEAIAEQTRVYINGQEAPLYLQQHDRGIFSVIGLSPNTTYVFKATMMSGVENPVFTPEVTVTTEGIPQLPNADFEDRQNGVKYKDLPSGGKYSQTVVEIFNWQHSTSIEQEVPKQWANTNAKTFAMASDIHNTWYMQPSVALTREPVFSQSFAVELTSVAFDPHGKPVPNYTQTGMPYLDYSPIVPEIAYRAAGKLFLGQYSFDPATMTESYSEGLTWNSRPSSLNGYYRYIPCDDDRSDCGLAIVEVLGESEGREVVIASGTGRLTLASGYTAFSVPLNYSMFGVKAKRIKVMFSSSSHIGSIEEESRNVITVPDARSATSAGAHLWIDNITLAY